MIVGLFVLNDERKIKCPFPGPVFNFSYEVKLIYDIYVTDNFLQSHLYSEYLTLNENKYYEITTGESFWLHIRQTY